MLAIWLKVAQMSAARAKILSKIHLSPNFIWQFNKGRRAAIEEMKFLSLSANVRARSCPTLKEPFAPETFQQRVNI